MHTLRTAFVLSTALACASAHAQLITSWTAPAVDDGNPIPNFVNSWNSDTTTGEISNLTGLFGSSALAADNVLGRLYASSGTSLNTFGFDATGNFAALTPPVRIRDTNNVPAESRQIQSFGFVNGTIVASVFRSSTDERRRRGLPRGLYAINPANAIATLIPAAANLPVFNGMDYNEDDGFMYAVVGNSNAQSIVRFDLTSFTMTTVAAIPASAYAGATVSFDGVAVGEGKVFLTTGLNTAYGNIPIAVFNLSTGAFEASLPSPRRTSENRWYPAGATYFRPFAAVIGDNASASVDVRSPRAAESDAPVNSSDPQ
jgi:hypothetical protein